MLILGLNKREKVIVKLNKKALIELGCNDDLVEILTEHKLELFLKPEIFSLRSVVRSVFNGPRLFEIERKTHINTSSGR